MLNNAWLIPLLPAVAFVVILFFGKRLPQKGSEVGVASMGLAFLLSCVCLVQWVQRPADLVVEPAHAPTHAKPAADDHAKPAADDHAKPSADDHAPTAADDHAPAPAGDHAPTPAEPAHASAAEEGAEHHAEPVRKPIQREVVWWHTGKIEIKAGIHIDGLAVVMLFVVTLISLAVHVFSTNYMHDDRRYTHYFAGLSLFTAGMLLMVVSSNTLQLLFGWEAMGLCSFMLIGHWWEDKKNSNAALKAFLTTRTGDIGLLVGMSILFFGAGQTFDIGILNQRALSGQISHTVLVAGAVCLFLGVIGKSAQFPLHTWLPDAMAGPTPVSALIHAATMVVAGVYLVARVYGVFWEGFSIADGGLNFGAVIGATTVIIAALLAFVQDDIKKVLAYSTVSQLGYMVMALCVGAWTAGVFHLFTHAFFKGLLFLGSGSVSHAVHSFDMKKDMGGLRKYMPTTYWTFMVGSLALAGIFPLAGFWSKDEILVGAQGNNYPIMLGVGIVGALMTAAYMTRCVYLTFFGEYRGHGHPHESPRAITVPLVVLAVLSVGAGLLNAPKIALFSDWTANEVTAMAGVAHHDFNISLAGFSLLVALSGIAIGAAYYFRDLGPHGLTQRSSLARTGFRFLENKYYLDHVYTGGVVGSLSGPIARAAYWVNQNVIDAVVNGAGTAARRTGLAVYDVIDQGIVDGAVNGAGLTASEGGGLLRTMQTGRIQQYAAVLFGATAAFALALVFFK